MYMLKFYSFIFYLWMILLTGVGLDQKKAMKSLTQHVNLSTPMSWKIVLSDLITTAQVNEIK